MAPIINAQKLSKRYGLAPLFEDISFTVSEGERIGLIRFGSRVDVYLPEGVRPLIAEGQTAIAGETVIADLAARDPQRTFRVG